jgi:hypothetical protein
MKKGPDFKIRSYVKDDDVPFIRDSWAKHCVEKEDWLSKQDRPDWLKIFKNYIDKCLTAFSWRVAYKPTSEDRDYIYGYTCHEKDKVMYTHIKWHYRKVEDIRKQLEEVNDESRVFRSKS